MLLWTRLAYMKILYKRALKRSISLLRVLGLISSKKSSSNLLHDRQCIYVEFKSALCWGGAPTWFEFEKFKTVVGQFIRKGEIDMQKDIWVWPAVSYSLLILWDPEKQFSQFCFFHLCVIWVNYIKLWTFSHLLANHHLLNINIDFFVSVNQRSSDRLLQCLDNSAKGNLHTDPVRLPLFYWGENIFITDFTFLPLLIEEES